MENSHMFSINSVVFMEYFLPKIGKNKILVGRLTLFYTRGFGIVVLHVMFPEPYRFPLCFLK
jgi:hypothetical protein